MIRTKNVTGRGSCDWCRDDGFVVDEGPHDCYDVALAPCPFCERGYKIEFPDLTGTNKDQRIRPPWSQEKGYWQGRSLTHLEPARKGPELRLPPAEQRMYLRQMGRMLGFLKDVDAAIGEPTKETPA